MASELTRRTVLGGLAAVAAASAVRGGARAPLAVGLLLPRSGYLARAGDACFAGAQLAAELLPDLGLPHVTLIEGDIGENPTTALTATDQVIERGARILIGCFDSGPTVAVAARAEERRVPLIVNVGAAPSITQQGYRFVFRNFPDARRIVGDSYALQKQLYAASGYTPRKLVLMYINNGRGIELIDELWTQAQMPYERAPPVAYDPKATDLTGPVAAARATGADALWTVSRMDDAIRITRELVRTGWCPGVILSSNAGLHEPVYRDALGANADLAVTFAPYYNPGTRLARRVQALQSHAHPGVPLGTAEIYTFEALLIAADAYQRSRSSDPEALRNSLRSCEIRESLTGGVVRFDSTGQNTALGLTAIQNLNGAPRVVLPSAAAEAKPQLPRVAWS